MVSKHSQLSFTTQFTKRVLAAWTMADEPCFRCVSRKAIIMFMMLLCIISAKPRAAHSQPRASNPEREASDLGRLIALSNEGQRTVWFLAVRALGQIAARDSSKRDEIWSNAHVNTLGMKFVHVEPGEFVMGSDKHRIHEDFVAHPVKISHAFFIAVTEVTNEQLQQLLPSFEIDEYSPDPDSPAVKVTWEQARRFCELLSKKESSTYRLPTEAEWEYSCRAGTRTQWSFGRFRFGLSKYGWCDDEVGEASPVGKLRPNGWGIYDMHGNVLEWVHDWFSHTYYLECAAKGLVVDPTGPPDGRVHVLRSGAWLADNPLACTCTARFPLPLLDRAPFSKQKVGFRQTVGFRVLREAK